MRGIWRDGAVATAAVLLFAGVFALRSGDPDPGQALSVLYTLPICLVGARWGLLSGLGAAVLAVILTAVWAWQWQVELTAVGQGARITLFLATGLAVGLLADRSTRAGQAAQRLLALNSEARHQEERGRAVQRLTARLSRAATTQDVARAYTEEGLVVLGATQGGVYLLGEDDCLRLLAVARPLEDATDWTSVPLAARTPPSDAARTGAPNYQRTVAEIEAAYPPLAATRSISGDQAWAAAPMRGTRGTLGAIAAAYSAPHPFAPTDRELIATVAERVAEAVERALLLEVATAQRARAEAAELRASLLADVGAVLTASTHPADSMQRLTDLLVPRFADQVRIDRTEEDPRTPRRVHLARTCHGDADSVVAEDDSPLRRTVPLTARRSVIGYLVLERFAPRPPFEPNDVLLISLIAGRTALALDSAQLYERQRDVATTLQHALLPGDLPQIPGVTASARYFPGSATLDVGGDWYDVLHLPGRRVGIVLGDVVGRGVAAAAAMGQLRSAVAALAPHSADPAEVLQRLDAFAASVPGAILATLVYLDYDPGTGVLRYSSAGHPPAMLLDQAGVVHRLDQARGVPLAARRDGGTRPLAELRVDPPTLLICYSDGLIERRGRIIDESIDELVAQVASLHGLHEAELSDALLSALAGDPPFRDDIALLIATLGTATLPRFHRKLSADPRELSTLRAQLRQWAARAGLDEACTADLLLATGEACANAVEHAFAGIEAGIDGGVGVGGRIDVEIQLTADGGVDVCVRDTGRWRESGRGTPGRGRGLGLIGAVSEHLVVTRGDHGTSLDLRLAAHR